MRQGIPGFENVLPSIQFNDTWCLVMLHDGERKIILVKNLILCICHIYLDLYILQSRCYNTV